MEAVREFSSNPHNNIYKGYENGGTVKENGGVLSGCPIMIFDICVLLRIYCVYLLYHLLTELRLTSVCRTSAYWVGEGDSHSYCRDSQAVLSEVVSLASYGRHLCGRF